MSDRLMTMVATPQPPLLDAQALQRAIKSMIPPSLPEALIAPVDDQGNSGLIATIGDVSLAIVPMPFAIPSETLRSALENEYIWKDAARVFSTSRGHVLISVLDPENDPKKQLQRARALTVVTAATLSVSSGIGAFWQTAQSVIQPPRFVEEARSVMESDSATDLWFSLRFFLFSDQPRLDQLVCQSTGLTAFLGREIECGPYAMPPGEMAEAVITTARFMATAGPIFGDGHTLGFAGSTQADAQLFLDWSALGGVNKPIFQLRLRSQEEKLQ